MEEHMKAIVAKNGSEAQDAGAFILEEQPIPEPGTVQNPFDLNKIHGVNHPRQKQQYSYVASLAASNGQRFFDLSSYLIPFSMFLIGSHLKVLMIVFFQKI